MTNEERDLITRFISRVGGAPQSGGSFLGGSVPSTQNKPALPPIDPEADQLIAQQFQQSPEARYRVTQLAIVSEMALAETQNRIKRLEWELEQTRHAVQQAPQGAPQQKGFFSNLFGGGGSAQQQPQGRPGVWGQGQAGGQGAYQPSMPPPQPQYAPGYQPGMFQRAGGSGFLGSALTTAAGVAGGMVVGNALMGAFGGGSHGGGSAWGGSGNEASNTGNPFDNGGTAFPASDPTAGYGNDPFGGGGEQKNFGTDTSWDGAGGNADPGSFDSGGGFDGGGSFGGGGFDDNN